jgi:ABC-type phosphate/phosphonate transport system substrate-binding protein
MTRRNGLSSPLATLVNLENGEPITQFGGVIAIRAGRHDLARLADLKGKVVATPDTGSFGGYQSQAYELAQAGLPVADNMRLLVTGMPHDTALHAMLEGRADAAFVRTGLIESMIYDGSVEASQIAVLNRVSRADSRSCIPPACIRNGPSRPCRKPTSNWAARCPRRCTR